MRNKHQLEWPPHEFYQEPNTQENLKQVHDENELQNNFKFRYFIEKKYWTDLISTPILSEMMCVLYNSGRF
jgi:hypothetical protein